MNRCLKLTSLGLQIHPPPGLTHITRDICPRRLPRTEAHRNRRIRGREAEVPHLSHGTPCKAHAIRAPFLRAKTTRIAEVRPRRGTKQRHFERGIAALLGRHIFELRVGDRHHAVVACEEHRLALTKSFQRGKEVGAGETLRYSCCRRLVSRHRSSQRGFSRIKIGLELHARHVE